ncbi:MAG: hypothetical protein OHK0053_26210 [Microscillaceae bacterium]
MKELYNTIHWSLVIGHWSLVIEAILNNRRLGHYKNSGVLVIPKESDGVAEGYTIEQMPTA